MKELLSLIEKLQVHWHLAISRRFLPFSVVACLAVIATSLGGGVIAPEPGMKIVASALALALLGTLWVSAACMLPHERSWVRHAEQMIEDCAFEDAERILTSPPPLLGFSARIRRWATLQRLKLDSGDLVAAYSYLLAAEHEALLPNERTEQNIARASLMHRAGNYTAFRKVLAALDSRIPASGPVRVRYALLKSHQHELDGEFSEAKALLEETTELVPEPKFAAAVFNNLARLEDMQGNDTEAQSYYERAWQLLRKDGIAKLYPVVGQNLLLKYGRNGAVDKAKQTLIEYREMIRPGNSQQYIQFLNDQTHLARQIGDRALLTDSYEQVAAVLCRTTSQYERLALVVGELRMRFNDGFPLAARLREAVALLDANGDLSVRERFNVLCELLAVLQQCNASAEGVNLQEMQRHAAGELMSMESEIDTQLRETPPMLPCVRDEWYGHKLEIHKLRIGLLALTLSKSDFVKLFDLLHQRQQMWADKGNAKGELDALIAICDEFVVKAEQLDPRFVVDHLPVAKQALAQAAQVLERQWQHPSVRDHSLAIAYFSWRLQGDRASAERWLLRFEKPGFSLAHNTRWFRNWYAGVRGWLIGLD
jgi:hypothetical protein